MSQDDDDENRPDNFTFFPNSKMKAKIIDFLAGISPVPQPTKDDNKRHWFKSFNHIFFQHHQKKERVDPLKNLNLPKNFARDKNKKDAEPRFEILCSGSTAPKPVPKIKSASGQPIDSKTQEATEGRSSEKVTGDNYQKKYEEEKKMAKDMADQKNKEAHDLYRQTQDKNQKNRAVQLRDEINAWKLKVGTGEHEESVVQGQLENLQREYFSIDYKNRPE